MAGKPLPDNQTTLRRIAEALTRTLLQLEEDTQSLTAQADAMRGAIDLIAQGLDPSELYRRRNDLASRWVEKIGALDDAMDYCSDEELFHQRTCRHAHSNKWDRWNALMAKERWRVEDIAAAQDILRGIIWLRSEYCRPLLSLRDRIEVAIDRLSQKEKSTIGNAVETVKTTTDTTGGVGFVGGRNLADALGVHPSRRDAFLNQMGRKRISLGDGAWQEVRDKTPNDPVFLYKVDEAAVVAIASKYQDEKPA